MKIELTSFKPVSLPHAPTATSQQTLRQMHHSSLQSLSIHQKEPSTFFTCIKRFFETLCLPFVWLYNLFFPTKEAPEPQEITPKVEIQEFDEIENKHPDMSIDQFLTHLAENANEYKLFYGIGNGT